MRYFVIAQKQFVHALSAPFDTYRTLLQTQVSDKQIHKICIFITIAGSGITNEVGALFKQAVVLTKFERIIRNI